MLLFDDQYWSPNGKFLDIFRCGVFDSNFRVFSSLSLLDIFSANIWYYQPTFFAEFAHPAVDFYGSLIFMRDWFSCEIECFALWVSVIDQRKKCIKFTRNSYSKMNTVESKKVSLGIKIAQFVVILWNLISILNANNDSSYAVHFEIRLSVAFDAMLMV